VKLLFLSGIFLFISCGSLFYQPQKKIYTTPKAYKFEYENIFFKSLDSTRLNAWLIKSLSPPNGIILFFHGNAQNISTHFMNLAWISKYGWDIFMIDYRGYGQSEGRSSKEGIYQDVIASFDYIKEINKNKKYKRVVLYGQSLGGIASSGALIDYKSKHIFDTIILDSTFDSYLEIGKDVLKRSWITTPFSLLTKILLNDKHSLKNHYSKLPPKSKYLIIHGTHDKVVPYRFGKRIFDNIPFSKQLWTIKNGHHIGTYWENNKVYRKKLLDYLNKNN